MEEILAKLSLIESAQAEQSAALRELSRQVAGHSRLLNANCYNVSGATPKVYKKKGRAYVISELESRFGTSTDQSTPCESFEILEQMQESHL